jgi:hypothetical protein
MVKQPSYQWTPVACPQVYLYGTEALGYDLSLKSTLHAAGM